ncbi:MAG TPA: carbon-nitrogen hydrolase family protein, partial [Bacteroidia bacterium]|nr:carbon-nitrogen hydrolase family protein [Bacteroidia bacterium]
MLLALAQLQPTPGNVDANIQKHLRMTEQAAAAGAELIVFPELSLTGYEPKLAKQLACDQHDNRFDIFQTLSDKEKITICLGMPVKSENGIHISMLIFRPGKERLIYSKQHLHTDELPYFVPGTEQVILNIDGYKIAPAICYESLLPEHAAAVAKSGADIYLSSVAKPANGVTKAYKHFPEIAKHHGMTVVMANCTGPCDNFLSVGQSAVWNNNGKLTGK